MKKTISLILTLMLILSLSIYADGEKVGEASELPELVAQEDGMLLEPTVYKGNFLQRLFGSQSFSFVSLEREDAQRSELCTVKSTHGSFDKPAGKSVKSGGQCNIGDFIAYISDGGEIGKGTFLFTNLWLKKDADDLPNMNDFWTEDKSFKYSYACYQCDIQLQDDFEKGCLAEDKKSCLSKSDSTCDIWYGFEKVCLSKIDSDFVELPKVTIGRSIDITNAKTDKEKYEVGDIVYVFGYAKINKDVNDAVIESSLEFKNYVTVTPLSIAESEVDSGVCGDDITTGVKFDAKAGDKIKFILKMTAKKSGKYDIDVISAEGCGEKIKDKFTVDQFSITGTDTEDNSQQGTVTIGDAGDDLTSEGTVTDFEDFVPGTNQIKKVSQIPEKTLSEQYFDFKNNPTIAYSITAILLIIAILIGVIVMPMMKKKKKR